MTTKKNRVRTGKKKKSAAKKTGKPGLRKKPVSKKRAAKHKAATIRKKTIRQTAKKRTGKTKATKKLSSKTATVKKKTKKMTSTSDTEQFITITNDSGSFAQIALGKYLQELAMRWRYVLTRRLRWKHSSRTKIHRDAYVDIANLMPSNQVKAVLGDANVVEVQVPYRNKRSGWEGRVAPWEFLISATAAVVGNSKPLTIVRCLKIGREPLPAVSKPRVLYVECLPGALSGSYEFTSERRALERVFEGSVSLCINPTIAELRRTITKLRPHVIHLAGIDNNQARELLRDEGTLPQKWLASKKKGEEYFDNKDGIFFTADDPDDSLGLVPIGAQTLAEVLNSGSGDVHLVTANVYHSASRICSLAVAEGAGLALGFQDTVSDSLAEIFLGEFYTDWKASQDALAAFVGALDVARTSASLSGTGIVLWSSQPLLDGAVDRIEESRESRKSSREKVLKLDADYAKWLKINIKVGKRLNYSLLHNDSGGLFKQFEFRKEREGILRDVNIEVILYLGSESHPYRSRITLTESRTPVEQKIKVPLTSSIIRTVSEPMRTSLFVRVSVGDRVIHQDTHRVTLLPADEWKDTDTDRIWLPSFVLPRDPAIEKIVEQAQKHLITLADNLNCGFDGYQSIDPDYPENLDGVDLQVQAIWATVVSDFGIRYINPPPSYSEFGQRLRTPTQIVRGGRGTCIDLALLFSACLEYIEIYPVVFLLEGHAFAGYWRSEDRYYTFAEGRPQSVEDAEKIESTGPTAGQPAWIMPSDSYTEIRNEVGSGFLFPLETVGFTTHGSFREAIKEGIYQLLSRTDFHSLIDIWIARRERITPLPIIDDVAHLRGGNDND